MAESKETIPGNGLLATPPPNPNAFGPPSIGPGKGELHIKDANGSLHIFPAGTPDAVARGTLTQYAKENPKAGSASIRWFQASPDSPGLTRVRPTGRDPFAPYIYPPAGYADTPGYKTARRVYDDNPNPAPWAGEVIRPLAAETSGLIAAARQFTPWGLPGGVSVADAYHGAVDSRNAQLAALEQQHPIASYLARKFGQTGMRMLFPEGLLGGAAAGAVQGAIGTQGGAGDRVVGALEGAATQVGKDYARGKVGEVLRDPRTGQIFRRDVRGALVPIQGLIPLAPQPQNRPNANGSGAFQGGGGFGGGGASGRW